MHNAVPPASLELATLRSQVFYSTTKPLRSKTAVDGSQRIHGKYSD